MNIFPDDSWSVFVPYSGFHVFTVCVCLLLIAALVAAGRRLCAHETAMRWTLGIFALLYWLSYNIWWNRNGFDPAIGLPLHICDLSGLIAPLALLTLNRWLRATLYFWAFALASQAFIQPALAAGPALPLFWWFWAQHTIVLGFAIFDVTVLSFRPGWLDLRRAYIVSVIYVCFVAPFDIRVGADYGYLGNLPADKIPPFVAALGPWPARAFILTALVAVAFLIVALPWQLTDGPWRQRSAT
ncbi:MAG: TIGR02206 family membrane protein [Xanthobacteraceae bacterium]